MTFAIAFSPFTVILGVSYDKRVPVPGNRGRMELGNAFSIFVGPLSLIFFSDPL